MGEGRAELPPCHSLGDLFFGPCEDGRTELNRGSRERIAKAICFSCPYRLQCLERAMVWGSLARWGVWGGMTEGERRSFRVHLDAEGYGQDEVPTGSEFVASLVGFYNKKHHQRFSVLEVSQIQSLGSSLSSKSEQ